MNAAPPTSAKPLRSPAEKLLTGVGSLAVGVGTIALAAFLFQATPHRTANLILVALGIAVTAAGLATLLSHSVWAVLESSVRKLGIRPFQLPLLSAGVVLSIAARSAAGDGTVAHVPIHGLLWVMGIGCVAAGWWSAGEGRPGAPMPRGMALGLLGLLAVSLAARAIDLNGIPPILGGDEGALGLTAAQFAAGERNNLLALGWFSWPAMHAWIVSQCQGLLGPTVAAIRWPSAAAGTLTVLATLWMGCRLFGPRVGWLSAVALSASHVHLLFSRVAMNNVFDGLLLAIAVGALWVAWESNRRWAFLLTGLAVGLSPYFYATARLIPLLLLAWVLVLRRTARWHSRASGLIAMALTATVTALPIVVFYAAHPDEWLAPLSRVSSLNPAWLQASGLGETPTVGLLASEFSSTLLGLVARPLLGVYYPGIPYFDPLSAAFFLAGVALALCRLRRPQFAILPIVLLATGLIGAFSLGAPSSQRLVFAAPILAVCVALPADGAIEWGRSRWPSLQRPLTAVTVGAFLAACLYQTWFFFDKSMPLARYSDIQGLVATELGLYLQRFLQGTSLYFVDPGSMGVSAFPSLAYLAPRIRTQSLEWPAPAIPGSPPSGAPLLWVTFPEQARILDDLKAAYPQTRTLQWMDAGGRPLFYLLEAWGPGGPLPGGASGPPGPARSTG